MDTNRRDFLKSSLSVAAGVAFSTPELPLTTQPANAFSIRHHLAPSIRFAVINPNHSHIYGMVDAVTRGGGQLVSVCGQDAGVMAAFTKRYPDAKVLTDPQPILEDKSIQLILTSDIASERAPLGIRAMQHGKDFLTDKPGITSLEQLAQARKVQKETGRIFSILYSEHFENKATVKAGELIKEGMIGKVIQTIGLGPHKMNTASRPEWFFDKKRFGGILTDIGSHQCEQFLFFTGSMQAQVVASQVGNVAHPQFPQFEDFGDMTLTGNGGTGYVRVDWFTPDSLKVFGDGRLTILGTEGFIELRKYTDLARSDKGSNLYLSNHKQTTYIDCEDTVLPFGTQFVNDIVNRTETAMTQAHCFLAMELALTAQKQAKPLKLNKA